VPVETSSTAPPEIGPDSTLAESKEWLLGQIERGVRCPCCTQMAKVYKWSLYSTAIHALILFYRIGGTSTFVHVNSLKERGYKGQGDATRLRMWGLVEEEKRVRADGGRAGYWRVTAEGERFILGLSTVTKYLRVFDGESMGMFGDQVDVFAALGERFDYQELMSR
jgi:hypothetical protein